MPIKGFLLFAGVIGSLPFCFVRPFYGILLWTVIAFLNPQSSLTYWSAANSFPWALVVAVPTLLGTLVFARGWRNLASLRFLLIALLWGWFTITSVLSANNALFVDHAEDTWLQWQLVSKILLMTTVTIALINSFERLRVFLLVISGCFGVYALRSFVFVIATRGAFRVFGPQYSMIADNNDFGLALNMTLPLFFFLAQTEVKQWMRWLFGCLFVCTIPVIFFTYSRGALIGLVVIMALMFFQSRRRLLLVPVIAIGIVVAFLLAPQSWQERMDPTRPEAVDASAQSRINAWTFSWNLATDYPLAGGGFATFTQELFDRYAPNPKDVHGPHSIYFGVLAEHGFIGLALYLSLVFAVFQGTWSVRRRARLRGDGRAEQYANMLQFSLVGFLTSGTFLGRAYFDYFFAIVACVIVLQRIFEAQWAEEDFGEVVMEPAEQIA